MAFFRNVAHQLPATVAPAPDPRFFTETVRLLGLFERYRDADDYANCTACFGALARHRFKELVQKPGYNPRQRSIISIFQPKSGGTFLHNRLLQLGYQEFWWAYPSRRCAGDSFASDEALSYYLKGGCACHSHARPSPNILAAFDRGGVDKIWVHLRNPAESVVSCYYHYLGVGHGNGEVGEKRKQEAISQSTIEGIRSETDASDFAIGAIRWYVDWIAEWLRFAEDHPERVVFSYYHELPDLQAMLSRVATELGVTLSGKASSTILDNDRYRPKVSTHWRDEVNIIAQDYIETKVRVELGRFEQFGSLLHCG
jgi:hypothetical protein